MRKKVTVFETFAGWRTTGRPWVLYPTKEAAQKVADWFNKMRK